MADSTHIQALSGHVPRPPARVQATPTEVAQGPADRVDLGSPGSATATQSQPKEAVASPAWTGARGADPEPPAAVASPAWTSPTGATGPPPGPAPEPATPGGSPAVGDPATGYAPEGRYLWDSWVLQDDQGYLLFHLDAPGSVDPDARHDLASIRQARSPDIDMEHWTDLGLTFGPGPKGAWDDKVIWSGNTYRENGTYYLFYTARHRENDLNLGQIQRIGVATSQDGLHWQRREQPLLEPDGRYYETAEPSPIYKAWRDPAIVRDPESGKYLMYFTAKTRGGDERYKGCIGLATADRIDGPYEVQPPICAPGVYAEMECPQVVERDGKTYLFFSTFAKNYQSAWAEQVGGATTGLHCFVGDSLTGPFEPLNGTGLVEGLGNASNLYGVHMVSDPKRPGEVGVVGWFLEDRPAQSPAPPVPGATGVALTRVAQDAFKLVPRPLPLDWSLGTPRVAVP